LKTSYLKAGKPGKYVAKGRVLRMGRSVAYSEAALYDGDGALVSKASATFKLLPK
jgi:acyl-coenzyme A thioesterase PaaI-like protein